MQLGSDIYVIAQIAAFDTTAGDPASGQLRMTDVQGDRLLITPHLAGASIDSMHKTEQFIANKILAGVSRG